MATRRPKYGAHGDDKTKLKSTRTLTACCQEHLGMGPERFLLLRRMSVLPRDLRHATPIEMTVTEIATRYGFWQFDRLALEHKALFGE